MKIQMLRLLALIAVPLFFIGCGSVQEKRFSGFTPWYEELNPSNQEIMSDFELLDLSPNTWGNVGQSANEMRGESSPVTL